MHYEWDEADRQANLKKHGVDFALVEGFDWSTARIESRNAMPPLKPSHISTTPEEAAAIEAAIADDPDTWEATGPLLPAEQVVPHIVKAYREGRLTIAPHLRKEHPKTRVTIRLDADVVARLRAGGPGWQIRANAALREAVLGK